MVEKYYGFTLKQLIGFYLLIAVVGYFVIFFVPFTSEDGITKTLVEILFFEPDIQIPTESLNEDIIVQEPQVSPFCRIYPTASACQ